MGERDRLLNVLRRAITAGNCIAVNCVVAADPSLVCDVTPFGTLLHIAASRGLADLVTWLVEYGADVNSTEAPYSCTPLDEAAGKGHVEVVSVLFEHGASLRGSSAETDPLFSAITGGASSCCSRTCRIRGRPVA
jgi:hypothetical protein